MVFVRLMLKKTGVFHVYVCRAQSVQKCVDKTAHQVVETSLGARTSHQGACTESQVCRVIKQNNGKGFFPVLIYN